MNIQPKNRSHKQLAFCIATIALLFMSSSSGCARLQLPRIDPTGNSIFLPAPYSTGLIGSNNGNAMQSGVPASVGGGLPSISQPIPFTPNSSVSVTPQAPLPTLPAAPVAQPASFGSNGPAFTQPAVPPACNGSTDNEKRKQLIPDPNRKLSPGQSGQLVMTPSRIVAPVGSEVVVLAGICGDNGYFVKNQPLEWMLSNDSVGEFVEIGGMHHSLFNKLVPPSSKKINGQYAWGRTGLKPQILSRGTPTPLDDIELRDGQTYVSVSSASPGTSYVTGVAPKAEGWDRRKATTTIHWVDGNWSIPTPSQATAGTVTALSTVITDNQGRGIPNWPVRYAIVGGAPAEFAPADSQTAESKSDGNGQATVQIRQPAGQFTPGTTQVRVDVVRPPIFGQPELVVESGVTSVTWSAPALTIRAIGPRSTEQGTPFNYTIQVSNPGDQVARNVVVRTQDLDDSIEYVSSTPKPTEYGKQYEWKIGDIAPGATPKTVELQLRSEKLGNVGLCFEVASNEDSLQTEACAETEIVQPCINLVIDGPNSVRIGDQVNYLLRVENRCDQPLENVEMVIAYDPGLVRPGKSNPTKIRLLDGGVLQVNQSETFQFSAIAQGAGSQCLNVTVTADGVRPERDRVCVNVGPADGTSIDQTPTPGNSSLGIELSGGRPMTFNEATGPETRSRVKATIVNRGNAPIRNVTLIAKASGTLMPTFVSQDFKELSDVLDGTNELWISIPQINPGQSIPIDIDFEGLQIDPNAGVQISVSSPSGGTATDSLSVPAVPKNQSVPNGFNPMDDGPIFGPDNNSNGGISIPSDAGVGQGGVLDRDPITVVARFDSQQVTRGRKLQFPFSVTNNLNTPITKVDIDLLVPNSLTALRLASEEGYQLLPGNRLPRINEIRPGQRLDFIAEIEAGSLPGPATLEVKVQSDQTPVPITASDSVQVN